MSGVARRRCSPKKAAPERSAPSTMSVSVSESVAQRPSITVPGNVGLKMLRGFSRSWRDMTQLIRIPSIMISAISYRGFTTGSKA